MNEGIKKFEEMLKTDEGLQKKLQAAMESYSGEKTEKAIFENVLCPLAAEYDIHASYDEYKAYLESMADAQLSGDELSQVAGGTKGLGASACWGFGVGIGGHGQDGVINAMCVGLGFGDKVGYCTGEGKVD